MLLDEPTTFLDLAHQVEVLDLLARLNATEGRTVVLVLHGLNHACRYAHHLVAMAGGSVVAEGPPDEVVTEDLVRRVFGLDTRIIPDPVAGTPLVVSLGLHGGALEPTAGSSAAGPEREGAGAPEPGAAGARV